MPAILSFPLHGPSRRADVPVVEVRLDTRDPGFPRQCPGVDEVNQRLAARGMPPLPPEDIEARHLAGDALRFAELLGRLARHLQRHAGHPVDALTVRQSRFADWRILVLVEHAHGEVGVAAVQLAVMLLGPQPAAFAANHPRFMQFARARITAAKLTASARAAERRDIPTLFLSRPPLDKAIQGAGSATGQGLLQLGHGTRRRLIDGSADPAGNEGANSNEAADSRVEAMFPDPRAAHIPLVAVTGTNGKTTTTRMVAHILDRAGYRTGVTTSEGITLAGKPLTEGDSASFEGHARVLTDPGIDAAVLETHHRGIVIRGFAWRHCDVGLCLNVSEDHIAPGEIESLEEMAAVKAAVPLRASGAAILFADDPHCRAMAPRLRAASTWWVSLHQSAADLESLGGSGAVVACTLETEGGEEWVVVHRGRERLPLMPVARIPATFDGAARFMVSNAMHAASAALALDLAPDQVADALGGFEAGEAMTPGRLNDIGGLPFRLILDFAHNPDGMARLVEFTDRLPVQGRKLLALSGMAKRPDDMNRRCARAAAGHFDHYFCKEYTPPEPPLARRVAPVMQAALMEDGVDPAAISVLSYGKETLFEILSRCEAGDLLVYLIGNAEKAVIGAYVDEFRRRGR
jgi:UDP-N-acetylmuramyl tripeptide synthase